MSLVAQEDDLPKLDKFELREEIGHGGMATVYRARDPRLGRDVAVKIIHRHLRDNPEVATRFVAEARAAAKLKHRGIVEVYDVSAEDDREKYLVVELIRGCTLRKTLQEHRDMPAEIGAAIVAELCDAVEHAHAAGIIHRDIKPENVLIELPGDRKKAFNDGDSDLEAKSGATPVGLRARGRDEPPAEITRNDKGESVRPGESDADDDSSEIVSARATPIEKSTVRAKGDRPSQRSKDRKDDSKSEAPRSSDPSPSRAPKSGRSETDVVIKLTDFGIAKVLDAAGVTSTGQVLGSPAHMAPEQIDGGDIDPRTDVFALGVLLYECLVGHLPFEGKNPAQVLRRVIEGVFSPADLEKPSVGGTFAKIAAAALATNPADRPETPHVLAEALRKELKELGFTDERKEIADYFDDPTSYIEALSLRVVPKLVARGEASRKSRKVQLAASDFNRAHALAPNDPAILRRITKLTSSAGRERMLRRVGAITAAAVVLGGATYGIARTVRLQSAKLNPTDSGKIATDNQVPVPINPTNDEPSGHPQVVASSAPVRIRSIASLIRPVSDPGLPRDVVIGLTPMGALLSVDGTPIADAMGKRIPLAVGPHSYVLQSPAGSDCCLETKASFVVEAAPKDSTAPQVVSLQMQFKPATVSLAGAPPGGSVVCGPYSISATPQDVKINAVDKLISCDFQSGKKSVTLKAGAATKVPWPEGG